MRNTAQTRDPLGGSAYERAAIRDRELSPGSRVTESELANWLGVSRTPIREAILRLEQEGMFTYAPHQGLIVAALDYQSVIELYSMREVLEGAAANLAARHASLAEVETLRGMIEHERNIDQSDAGRAASAIASFTKSSIMAPTTGFCSSRSMRLPIR